MAKIKKNVMDRLQKAKNAESSSQNKTHADLNNLTCKHMSIALKLKSSIKEEKTILPALFTSLIL